MVKKENKDDEIEIKIPVNNVLQWIFILVILAFSLLMWNKVNELEQKEYTLYELVDKSGYAIGCNEYEQIEVLAWNTTTEYCFPICENKTTITQYKPKSPFGRIIRQQPSVKIINGDCIKYALYPKTEYFGIWPI